MDRQRIAVTRLLPGGALDRLRTAGNVAVHTDDRAPTRDEVVALARDADGLLCLLTERIDAALFDATPRLRVVSNYAVGVDNIDVAEATRRGILVTNTPDVLAEATADLTWALLLAACRRLGEGERLARSGEWRGWAPMQLLGADVYGMTILHHTRRPVDAAVERALGARSVGLEELLRESDIVSLHVPHTAETRHFINGERLRLMKRSAYLVNTARGAVIDEAALVDALRDGIIAGAGLDVYEHEPRLTPGLLTLENVVLAPHLGSATIEARTAMAGLAADNLLTALAGLRPPHPVNSDALKLY